MRSFDLYGYKDDHTLTQFVSEVEKLLKVAFEIHNSYYRGGDYYIYNFNNNENVIIQTNYNKIEKEFTEPVFKDFKVLIYVNYTIRLSEIHNIFAESIPTLKLLSKKTIE